MRALRCCGRIYRVPDYASDRDFRCPVCGKQIGTATKQEATQRDSKDKHDEP